MRTNPVWAMTMVSAFALALGGTSAVTACPGATGESASSIHRVDIQQLDGLLRDAKVSVFDANTDSTRTKFGIIPGAVLLTSVADYSLDQLPQDKERPLVFYCANTRCGASETAAQRAVSAGYAYVAVLPDGIMGWKQAGKPTASVPRS